MQTCPFICNVEKMSGPKRSIKITDHFICTSANAIYCITCTLCKRLCIGETGRRLGDRFRERLRDVGKDDKNASRPVARHFNLPNHSMQHMTVCSLSLHQGNKESRKTLQQKFIFQIGTLNPHGINERFSLNKFILLFFTLPGTNQKRCSIFLYINHTQFLDFLRRGASARNVSFPISLRWLIHITNLVDKTKFPLFFLSTPKWSSGNYIIVIKHGTVDCFFVLVEMLQSFNFSLFLRFLLFLRLLCGAL